MTAAATAAAIMSPGLQAVQGCSSLEEMPEQDEPEEIVMSNLTHERKIQVSVGVNAPRNNVFACGINDSSS